MDIKDTLGHLASSCWFIGSRVVGWKVSQDGCLIEEDEQMNCSSSLGTPIRRFDNRVLFARQGATSQGPYMKQASIEQGDLARPRGMCCNHVSNSLHIAREAPRFSRPDNVEHNFHNRSATKPAPEASMLYAPDRPMYARPGRVAREVESIASETPGSQWSPRMNVMESASTYVVTVELPGVDINDTRVEIGDKSLVIKGKRSMNWCNVSSCANGSFATYHRKEIIQGPYQVVWPLPSNVNKDKVSAEFVEGILQINIAKL